MGCVWARESVCPEVVLCLGTNQPTGWMEVVQLRREPGRPSQEAEAERVGRGCMPAVCLCRLQDIQLRDLHRTRAALHEAQAECTRLKQQMVLAQE